MASTIHEFFGFRSIDRSTIAVEHADDLYCPFLDDTCTKTLSDGTIAGVCTLKQATRSPVICCPVRLYADDYRILRDVADIAFGTSLPLVPAGYATTHATRIGSDVLAVFGKRWGGELRLPQRTGLGAYYVDWILARISGTGHLEEFVAVEVQAIDTTGNYRNARSALLDPNRVAVKSTAGLNWENVSKRILPQLIYKGNVLHREPLCLKGLFFVTPTQVADRVMDRLGGRQGLLTYPLQSSSITFMAYDIDDASYTPGSPLPLVQDYVHQTTVVQVAQAFAGPGQMPPQGVYEDAIRGALTP